MPEYKHIPGRGAVEYSPAEQAEVTAWRATRVDTYRDALIDRARTEAGRRVALLFGRQVADLDLAWPELNALAGVVALLERARRAMCNEIGALSTPSVEPYPGVSALTRAEDRYLDQQLARFSSIVAIRSAEVSAAAALEAAGADQSASVSERRAELAAAYAQIAWP